MDTEVVQVGWQEGDTSAVRRAAEVLRRGGLVAFPTETVYGVAARADDSGAVARLRDVKQRSHEQAFTVHVPSPSATQRFAPELSGLAERLIRKGWPGPLTLILPIADPASAPVMANLNGSAAAAMYYDNTIGFRCPDDETARDFLEQVEAPIVAASANAAGRPAPTNAEDVLAELNGKIDLLIDGGETRYAKPSTIVRVIGASYDLLREGVYDARIVADMSRLRVLLVCTGNTCRSPMAAGLAKKLLAERIGCGVDELADRGVAVSSAGTAGGSGRAAVHAIAVMRRRGVDLADHRSSALTADLMRGSDYVFAMTASHYDAILRLAPGVEDRLKMLLKDEDVQDPIGGTEEDYEACARTIERGLSARLEEISL